MYKQKSVERNYVFDLEQNALGLNYESFNDTCFFVSAVNEALSFILWSKGNKMENDRVSEDLISHA